jgi:hypothetical protein
MAAQLNENIQYIDESTGELIVNGYIYIGTAGLDAKLNTITIYSDRELTTPIANPQRTGADGRAVNKIWIPGKYSLKVEDSANVQKLNSLDEGESSTTIDPVALTNAQGTNDVTAEGSPTVTALVDKQTYVFTAPATNTGAMTLKIDATTAYAIVKNHDQAMVLNEVEANQLVVVMWNATDSKYELISNIAISFEDRLDGYASTGYVDVTTGDLDSIAGNSTYTFVASGVTNEPAAMGASDNGIIDTRKTGLSNGYQIIRGISGTSQDKIWFRTQLSDTWSTWSIVSTGIRTKVIDIGDWNMDTGTLITIAHGLTLSDIRRIGALIRNDADTVYYPIDVNDGYTDAEGAISVNATNITLARRTGGKFDSTDFDSTSYNRGWVTVDYAE